MMKLFFLLVFVGCNEHDLQSWGQLHPKYSEEEANPKIPEVVVEALAAEILNYWEFSVKLQSKQEGKIDYQKNAVISPITMHYNVYDRTENFTQKDRRRREPFTQTATPTPVSDRQSYTQTSNAYDRALDILLVVDTSGSMKVERKTLGDNLSALLMHVDNTNWQIAVTTTDVGDCLDSKWIIQASKRSTFANIITEGITQKISVQADTERPILMAVNALGGNLKESELVSHLCRGRKSTAANNDWVRSASHIVVIIITDEPTSSSSSFGTTSVAALPRQLNEIGRTAKEDYQIHGIVSRGSRSFYEEIIAASGGVVGIGNGFNSANKEGYDTVLNEISTSTLILLTQTLDIKDIAAKHNFILNSVMVSGSKQNNGLQESGTHYTYADKIITFLDGYIPSKNSTITVDYSYTTTSLTDYFDLDYPPLRDSITVNPTSGCSGWTNKKFTVHNKKVTFANKPPDGCKFALEYKRADISLRSTVSLSIPSDEEIVDNSIEIGNKNVSSNFNAATKKLKINPASNDDGKNFTIKYQTRKRKLQYDDLKLDDKLTDTADITCAPPPCQYEKGKLIFEEKYFTDGKTIQVEQPLTTAKYSFSLVEGYKTDTLSLTITDRSNKQRTCKDLDIQNNKVILDSQAAKNKCAKLNDLDLKTVTLNPYKYLDERKFTISDTNFFTYHQHRSENWTVYIDNQKQSAPDYDVDTEKRVVSFKAQPPAGSEVKIEVSLTL